MDRATALDVLRRLGSTSGVTQQGDWLMTTCPLAPWTHSGGTDNSPSFGIHLEPDGTSVFNCFSCHKKGPVAHLVWLMEGFTGESYGGLKKEIEDNELFMGDIPEWSASNPLPDSKPLTILPEALLKAYPEIAVDHPFLKERFITNPDAIRKMELRSDTDSRGVERVVFPVRDIGGGLLGFTGRAIDKSASLKVRDYANLPKSRALLGSHLVDKDKPLAVVEGLFAYATMVDYGFNAVALMGSSLSPQQAQLLLEINKPLYLFLDNDKAGRGGVEHIKEKLQDHLPLFRVTYPSTVKEGEDPNDLYKLEIQEMFDKAELL